MNTSFSPLRAACASIFVSLVASSCSASSSPASGPGTPVTDAGMASCAPLQSGCFVASGAYATPSTSSCSPAGKPKAGAADAHCKGVAPQSVSAAACSATAEDAGATDTGTSDAAGEAGMKQEAGGAGGDGGPSQGLCGAPPGNVANASSDYGATMYGTEGDDDDCKYHLSYEATPLCENDGVYFIVKASYLTRSGAPLTGACTFAELCLNNEHPGPLADARPPAGKQQVVEGPPGTYTIGPVEFDASGTWTVRFHFNEECCDLRSDSPHGHAAFFVEVP